jgi:hypothetical protein
MRNREIPDIMKESAVRHALNRGTLPRPTWEATSWWLLAQEYGDVYLWALALDIPTRYERSQKEVGFDRDEAEIIADAHLAMSESRVWHEVCQLAALSPPYENVWRDIAERWRHVMLEWDDLVRVAVHATPSASPGVSEYLYRRARYAGDHATRGEPYHPEINVPWHLSPIRDRLAEVCGTPREYCEKQVRAAGLIP